MDQFLVEMEYSHYAAKEELFDSLSELSLAYNLPNLTLEQVEQLNEMTLATVGVYITKITSGIAKAWADFKAGYQDSMWISYKKIHEKSFTKDVSMTISGEFTIPKISVVEEFFNTELPKWDNHKDKPIKEKEDFFKEPDMKAFSHLYVKDKSMSDIVDEYYFDKISDLTYGDSTKIIVYLKFMNTYSKKLDNISANIQSINNDAKQTKADAENAQHNAKKAEEKKKQEAEKAKKDAENAKAQAEKEKEQANKEVEQAKAAAEAEKDKAEAESKSEVQNNSAVFNMANYIMEAFLYEAENDKPAEDAGSKPEEKKDDSSAPLSDESFNSKLEWINLFYSSCSEILSAKMKTLNKSRKIAFDIIKRYVKEAEKDMKEQKKKEKEIAKSEKK